MSRAASLGLLLALSACDGCSASDLPEVESPARVHVVRMAVDDHGHQQVLTCVTSCRELHGGCATRCALEVTP